MKLKHIAAIAFALIVASPAQASSYNCALAELPTEILICQDADLSQLDERNATVFFKLLNEAPRHYRHILNELERGWLANRNSCGYDKDCIAWAYIKHNAYLCGLSENMGVGVSECEEEPVK